MKFYLYFLYLFAIILTVLIFPISGGCFMLFALTVNSSSSLLQGASILVAHLLLFGLILVLPFIILVKAIIATKKILKNMPLLIWDKAFFVLPFIDIAYIIFVIYYIRDNLF